MVRIFLALVATWLACIGPAAAQEDEGRIVRFLEEQLSDGGARQVDIQGFRGALSSIAELDRLVISDADGPWLILDNARLEWTRSALLSGALSVQELVAERLEVRRLPVAEETGLDLPEAEATPFALPELPVSIQIDRTAIDELVLGEDLLGFAARLSFQGSARLDGGEGALDLELQRLDGPRGVFDLAASYANANETLDLNLLLEEAEGGLASELLGLPGRPSVRLAIAGSGPIGGFSSDIELATDSVDRLTGRVTSDGSGSNLTVLAEISGDISPLLEPDYRPFFGTDVSLMARVAQSENGALDLSDLQLRSAALDLDGSVFLTPDGRPSAFDVTGRIASTLGDDIRLPVAGTDVQLGEADLSIRYDEREGDAYDANFRLNGFTAGDLSIETLNIDAGGLIAQETIGLAISSSLILDVRGLQHTDPATAKALGAGGTLTGQVSWIEGAPVFLTDLTVNAGDLDLTGTAALSLAEAQLGLTLDLEAGAEDLSRFDESADLPLSGALTAELSGQVELLSGAFDLSLDGVGQDLVLVDSVPEAIFAGRTVLSVNAVRDAMGLRISDLILDAAEVEATGQAAISADESTIEFSAQIAEIGRFTDVLNGAASVDISASRSGPDPWMANLSLDGPNGIDFDLTGSAELPDGDISLALDGRMSDIGPLADPIRGPATATATLSGPVSGPWQTQATVQGPNGITASLQGDLGLPDGAVNLRVQGQAPLSLANRSIRPRSVSGTMSFDVLVDGQPSLAAISGRFGTNSARVALPILQTSLEGVFVNGQIRAGQAQFEAGGDLATGGTLGLTGRVGLDRPGLPAELIVQGQSLRLIDPTLYNALISQVSVSVTGALSGSLQVAGNVTLGETEFRVPESGLGAAAIPNIRHIGETPGQRLTRSAAGLLGSSSGAGGSGGSQRIALDLTLNAPSRIFIRGRGLDAELGGSLRVGGTTSNVIPAGRFDLIRGRLSILGTRLDLNEGSASLQGSFDPFIRLLASSRSGGYRIDIGLIGAISNPEISLSSDPSLPEDEILAQLLFGRSVSALSPIQLLQMADAAASLAGGSSDSGIFANLREDLGLDDLDIQTDEAGNAAVRAGRYISENVYADVTVGGEETDLSLNIDLTDSVTARGSFSSDGSSSVGIFYERDY